MATKPPGPRSHQSNVQRGINLPLINPDSSGLDYSVLDGRFAYMESLEGGWFDGKSTALDPEKLRLFRTFLEESLRKTGLSYPRLYPIPDTQAGGKS